MSFSGAVATLHHPRGQKSIIKLIKLSVCLRHASNTHTSDKTGTKSHASNGFQDACRFVDRHRLRILQYP